MLRYLSKSVSRSSLASSASPSFVQTGRISSVLSRQGSLLARSFSAARKSESEKIQRKNLELTLVSLAGEGDLQNVKRLLDDTKLDVNKGDHDRRTGLHLAAAEGKLEMCKFLLSKGADVNATDRFRNTPLDDAVSGKHIEIIKFLRENGAVIGRPEEIAAALCREASLGNIDGMQMLVDAGADVNSVDYDRRTPLHLAASEGQVAATEWLLKGGAQVNAVDRFGNTPLRDAERGNGRHYRAVVQVLRESGAIHVVKTISAATELLPAFQDSLPIICERGGFVYAEAWVPQRENAELELLTSYVNRDFALPSATFPPEPLGTIRANNDSSPLGRAFTSQQPVVLASITPQDFEAAKYAACGVHSAVVIPIVDEGRVVSIVALYSNQAGDTVPAEVTNIFNFANGIVPAGVYGKARNPVFRSVDGMHPDRMCEIFKRLVGEGVFSAPLIYAEVDWFFNMGLQQYYLQRYPSEIMANHVHSFIAAKQFAKTTGNRENIWLHIENNSKLLGGRGPEQLLYMVPAEHPKMVAVERNVQRRIANIPHNRPYSFEYFTSDRPFVPRGSSKLAIYLLHTNTYVNPTKFASKERNIWEVASDVFLTDKSKFIRERYQDVIDKALTRLSPVCEQYEVYKDGTIPLMFAFSQGAGTSTSYMLQLTELMDQNGLESSRKFIETFANGVIVFSLYLKPAAQDKIDRLLKQFSMLHLVPQSQLTPIFLSGSSTAEQYTYLSAAARFIYYFINQRSEEFDTLAKVFTSDPLNLSRLRLLHTSLKREAVSQARIIEALTRHPKVVEEIFSDFETRVTGKTVAAGAAERLLKLIKSSCFSDMDNQILSALVNFNKSILKTNFYKSEKSALSFRLDTATFFQGNTDWPQIPYGLFFIMGSDFQGFHIRFQDIARGGIRLISSRDQAAYNRNLATLFAENYGLAYTQNKKNKDIPEFGSKGTVLLNVDSQGNKFLAFQKYTSGVLDLLINHPDIVDRHGLQELLFFGPDEGTADYMEWACKYAQKKKYPYWRSFTTGKPIAMGGIPHDLYGMTTRGVHKYVLSTLAKMGLDEKQVTKIQTGGPDGDLGSNEILLSQDKTKAIIDGSGVVYDPAGLDRTEMIRLAKARKTVDHFDVSKLGPGGFRVLVAENNVTLPDGELVESGLAFRNEFHMHRLATADLFVPCGGRPESVNLSNVRKLLNTDGTPKFKYVIEGANLFFTQDARMVLESAGVILYKDASANKGGVTSSSLEVLAALSLSEEEFTKHMCVTDPENVPPFYDAYVKEIQARIEKDAELEFECIWREHVLSKTHRYLLTDMVSDKINELNIFITKSALFDNLALRRVVLAEAAPRKLVELLGVDTIMQRVPESYIKAIFGAYLASRYVYKYGIKANEFSFFEFMQSFLTKEQPPASPSA